MIDADKQSKFPLRHPILQPNLTNNISVNLATSRLRTLLACNNIPFQILNPSDKFVQPVLQELKGGAVRFYLDFHVSFRSRPPSRVVMFYP